MSDLNATQGADGATNAGNGATNNAPAVAASGESAGSPGAPHGAADSGSATAAASADIPLSTGTQSQSVGDDGAGAALEADAAKLLGDAINDAPVAAVAAVVAAIPLIVRVEQLARRAFESGATDEHNLMAWLYQHADALKRAIAGASALPLSDDAKALVDELKGLL